MSAVMNPMSGGVPVLPWTRLPDEDRRYRRILLSILALLLLLSLLMPFLPVAEKPPEPVEEEPPRYVKLLLQRQQPVTPPPPEVKAQTAPQPEVAQQPKPVPKPEPRPTPEPESAREQAQRSGVLAMKRSLSELRDSPSLGKLDQSQLSTGGESASKRERSLLTSKVDTGSGGINTSRLSRDSGGGVELAGRNIQRVESPIGVPGNGGGPGRSNKVASRTDEEIQLVFDRNKGSIFAIYNRALRDNPALQGKVVLKLTIAPSGAVTAISVVSSELKDPELERKLSLRVKGFDFGAKDVETVTVTYPIEFFPS